jgi:hypothetical protein
MLAFDFIEQRGGYLILAAVKARFCRIVERIDVAGDVTSIGATAATAAKQRTTGKHRSGETQYGPFDNVFCHMADLLTACFHPAKNKAKKPLEEMDLPCSLQALPDINPATWLAI